MKIKFKKNYHHKNADMNKYKTTLTMECTWTKYLLISRFPM